MFKMGGQALTGVAQWVGHHPTKQKIMGWIPGQSKCLDSGFDPWSGCKQEATDQCFSLTSTSLSLSFSLLSPLSENKIKSLKIKQEDNTGEKALFPLLCRQVKGAYLLSLLGVCTPGWERLRAGTVRGTEKAHWKGERARGWAGQSRPQPAVQLSRVGNEAL